MYLIGDIGNTEIKICLFDKNYKVVKKLILKTNLISIKFLTSNLNFLKKYSSKINIILFSSVVPRVYSVIRKFLKKKLKLKCIELKQINLNKLVKIMVNKKQIGSDRISNAIGIIDKKSNFIILDFGTATTFDVVIKDKYLGGVIAPGVNLSLKTLISKASLIPPVNISKISKIIGTNTSSAVKSGFYWGYAGLIDNIIKLIIKQTNKPFKIILTGGLAHLFKNTIKGKIEIKKDLTINGLLKVAKNLK
jgi:type III pantothenate kinase